MNRIDTHVRELKLDEAVDLFGTGCHSSTLEAVLRDPEWATERGRILAEDFMALKEKMRGMLDTGKSRDYWVLEAGRYKDGELALMARVAKAEAALVHLRAALEMAEGGWKQKIASDVMALLSYFINGGADSISFSALMDDSGDRTLGEAIKAWKGAMGDPRNAARTL